MANSLNTLNLIQTKGGINIKQGDTSSELSFQLCDSKGDPISFLNAKDASIHLYSKEKKLEWKCKTKVIEDKISFRINKPLAIGSYKIEIKIEGHIFPSDQGTYIRITKGYESYTDSESAIVAIENAKNIADEAIKKAIEKNLKDIKGPKGDKGDDGSQGKEGPPGPKGEDGKDCEVIDNLESENGEKALSARQGKILNKKYDELFYDVDNGKNLIAKAIVDKKGKANKDDSFKDLASKIGEIKTGWEPGHKFSLGELKEEYEYYSDDEPYPVIKNIDDALSVQDTNDFYFITKKGKLSLSTSLDEVLSSDKHKYLNLWKYRNNRCMGVVSADNNGFILIYGISMILEELWAIETKIPSNKKIDMAFTDNILVVSANDKSVIEVHNLINKKYLRLYNYDFFYKGIGLVSIQTNNTISAMDQDGNIFTFNLVDYKLDKIIYCDNDNIGIHTSDKKIYNFQIINGVLQNPRLEIDLSRWAKGKFLCYSSYSSGNRYTYEGISLLVTYDKNVSIAYEWEYDKTTEVETKFDNLIISYVKDDVKILEVINLFTKVKDITESPNFNRIVKSDITTSNDYSSEAIYFVLNGNLCSWVRSVSLKYYILPKLPENTGDYYENS
ncbi:MAG: collagen-like protein [Finegoldia magna]|uniref:collagen-like triple helix repeat-containing protein n=1 Tax=Peptoniphilaceae TaxID=1570339 RepID=UPI0026EEED39|nr:MULTISPECIES: collagen-like protein [Peptoniphilaceae]MBS5776114.1 collagen-like protein [Finegoldia magna]MDU2566629.1 collagen-like protein [Anaerococcus sp.]MDU7478660.1 collagen-like protein [Finegoldia magna]